MSDSGPPSFTTDEILPLLIPSIVRDIASLLAQSVLYGTFALGLTSAGSCLIMLRLLPCNSWCCRLLSHVTALYLWHSRFLLNVVQEATP